MPETSVGTGASSVAFRMYTNYGHFIERAEVRVFEAGQSRRDEPLAVLEIGDDGTARWTPEAARIAGPVVDLQFVLRAYDEKGRFDETAPQSLWLVNGEPRAPGAALEVTDGSGAGSGEGDADALLAGYGENELTTRNIDLGSNGSVRVQGSDVPPGHTVWLAGSPVPVDDQGRFVAEVVLPAGLHTVEVAVLDEEGNGELFLRDLELEKSDWFYVAMADVTVAGNITSGAPDQLQGANAPTDPDSFADGRFAFYVDGKFGEGWRLTASADTREGPIQDIFTNFLDKSPDALFGASTPTTSIRRTSDDGTRRGDGADDGQVLREAQQGRRPRDVGQLRGRLTATTSSPSSSAACTGGNISYQTDATTSFGERRAAIDGFAADPGTVPAREEFRGTGGSLYYLRHRDVPAGLRSPARRDPRQADRGS